MLQWTGTKEQQLIHLHFGDVLFIAVLVIIAAVDQLTLDGYFFSFVKILFSDLGYFAPGNCPVPLRFCYFFAFCIAIAFIGSYAESARVFYRFPCSFTSGLPPRLPINCTLFFNAYIVLSFVPRLTGTILNFVISVNRLHRIDNTKMPLQKSGSRFLTVYSRN